MKSDLMKKGRGHSLSHAEAFAGRRTRIAGAALAMACGSALALPFDTGDPDLTVRWDNTIKYSNAFRLKPPSAVLTADANVDDGDRNFGKGLVSNRLDILSEIDVAYRDSGARMSGSGWYDTVYNRRNDNDSPFTANQSSVPYNEFTKATKLQAGKNVQLLDAFAYTKGTVDDVKYNVRLGQHSVLYGETLFFGGNGIAGAQSPIDINKLLSVPGTQFKELILPQPQISVQAQLNTRLSVGAYYQFQWHADRLPPAGGYFSRVDLLQEGAEQILTGPGNPPFVRTGDRKARNSGQGGIQLRWRPDWTEGELGFYAAQFNAKDPFLMVYPLSGTYNLLYANGIKTVGVSLSTNVDDVNLASELSFRHDQPLVAPGGSVAVFPGGASDPYPVGNTVHWNTSMIATLPRTSMWNGALLLGEIAFNSRLSAKNPEQIDPGSTKSAVALRVVFTPSYYQVLPGLDLNIPIGLGYNPYGRSSVIDTFNGGATHGGDFSIGVSGNYQQLWNFSLNYTRFLGREDRVVGPANAQVQTYTFGQPLKDRDFVALSLSRTF